jgi:hypothetical protein
MSRKEPVLKVEVPSTTPIAPPLSAVPSRSSPIPPELASPTIASDFDKAETQPISISSAIPSPTSGVASATANPSADSTKAETKPLPELSRTDGGNSEKPLTQECISKRYEAVSHSSVLTQELADTPPPVFKKIGLFQSLLQKLRDAGLHFGRCEKWLFRIFCFVATIGLWAISFLVGSTLTFYGVLDNIPLMWLLFSIPFGLAGFSLTTGKQRCYGFSLFLMACLPILLWRMLGFDFYPFKWLLWSWIGFWMFHILEWRLMRAIMAWLWIGIAGFMTVERVSYSRFWYDDGLLFNVSLFGMMILVVFRSKFYAVWEKHLETEEKTIGECGFVLKKMDGAKKANVDDVRHVPEERYLKFFVAFCFVAIPILFCLAFVMSLMRSDVPRFMEELLGVVIWCYLGGCVQLWLTALCAKAVLRTSSNNGRNLAALQVHWRGRAMGPYTAGICWKIIGGILGVAAMVIMVFWCNEKDGWIAGVLFGLIGFGTLALQCWCLGSICCAYSWNEWAAGEISRGLEILKNGATFERLPVAWRLDCLKKWMDALARCREMAVQTGAETSSTGLLAKGDEALRACEAALANEVAGELRARCEEATVSYREACITGASATARRLAEEAKVAASQGKWMDARTAASAALKLAPKNAVARRVYRKAFWKRGSKTAKVRKSGI